MEVTWEVEDGYVGKSRPQTTVVDDQELLYCDSDEERQFLVEETIQNDFKMKITWAITDQPDWPTEEENE